MSRRVHVGVHTGDIARVRADVIALKYPGALSGAAGQIAAAIGVGNHELAQAMPSRGCAHIVASGGRDVMFLRTSGAGSFSLDDARAFMVDTLKELRQVRPAASHVAFTLHAIGYDMDYRQSMAAAVHGLRSAITSGGCPPHLERITIVNREASRAELQSALDDVLPEGFIEAPDQAGGTLAPLESEFDVFISFKSEDAAYANRVFELLQGAGLRVFFSRETLPRLGSGEYHRQIDAAIDRSRHMVVVTSSASNANAKWVEYEWRAFLNEMLGGRKAGNLVTVLARGMKIEDLPLGLRNREAISLTEPDLPRLLSYTRPDADRFERTVPPASAGKSSARLQTVGRLLVAAGDVIVGTSWNEARRQAASFDGDGKGGWRLPALDELRMVREASLLPARFCYWSNDTAGKSDAFYMHFDDGHVGRGPRSYATGLSAVFVKEQE